MSRHVGHDERNRRMYRGGRANPLARWLARFWVGVFRLGVMPRRWVGLEVRGRKSGATVRFPIGMANSDGRWYLVSMLGQQCNWVKNVRSAGGEVVIHRRRSYPCLLVEIPVAERPVVIKRYLQQVPGARPHIPIGRYAPVQDFAAVAAEHPVFRVDPKAGSRALPSP